jgi:bla regulator protein BlaR1
MTTGFVINHLWQSSCFVLLAGLLAFVLRKNSPKVRYWVWLSASLKFLAPFALLVSLGSLVPWPARRAVSIPAPVFPNTLVQIAEPFSPANYATVPAHAQLDWVALAMGTLWALGFFAIMLVRYRSWVRIRATLRASTPVDLPIPVPAFTAPGAEEPGVVGFLRPVLVLPAQLLEHLNPRQLDAVLAHELCHVRRRDNLFAAVHMVVEAIFWFHPMVWWIGSRMMEERELACDEEVLRMGCEPADYVEGILTVCRFYKEAPLPCVSGVTGADVKRRLRAILAGSIAPELNTAKKAALAALGLAAVLGPIAVGALDAPAVNAQAPPSARSAAPSSIQSVRPAFEVASIRQCTKEDEAALAALEDAGGGGRGGAPAGIARGPGSLRIVCGGLEVLIAQAYLTFANGEARYDRFGNPSVRRGPAWMEKERYTIIAKPGSAQSFGMMHGPMMQALLENRFKLKIHRGSEKVPAYALVVAKGGPKLQPTKGCPADYPGPPPQPGQPCRYQRFTDAGMDTYNWTMAQLSILLGSHMNRTLIDKTGITGAFDFHLDLPAPPPPNSPGIDDPNTPDLLGAVMDAVQKLGLKLEPTKGSAEFVVIDHIERPTEN